MRRLLAWGLLACLGCSAEVTEVRLDGLDFDYAFAVFLADDGTPLRVGAVFGQHDGDTFGANEITVGDGEARVLLVTLTQAQLQSAVDDFDNSRAPELSVRLEAPPVVPTLIDQLPSQPPIRRTGLPPEASYFEAQLDGATVALSAMDALTEPEAKARGAITMFVPVNPEQCRRAGETPLRPYAQAAYPITAPEGRNVRDVVRLYDDVVLVVGLKALFVVTRDGPWSVMDETAYTLPSEVEAPPQFREAALVPPALGEETRTVWVTGGYPGEELDPEVGRAGAHGALWRVTLDRAGLVDVERVLDAPGRLLWSVDVASNGGVLVGGDNGFLYRKAPGASTFTEAPSPLQTRRPQPGADWISALRAFDDDRQPWVAATQGIVHELDPGPPERWQESLLLKDITWPEPFEFFAIDGRRRNDDDMELWASASRGGVLRRAGINSSWAQVKPTFPPRFAPCAAATSGDSPDLISLAAINDLRLQDGFMYLAYQRCTAVVTVRLPSTSDPAAPLGCVSLLTEEGVDPGFMSGEYVAFEAQAGELVVLRSDGQLLVSTWPTD